VLVERCYSSSAFLRGVLRLWTWLGLSVNGAEPPMKNAEKSECRIKKSECRIENAELNNANG
jgi:hypothetical protein